VQVLLRSVLYGVLCVLLYLYRFASGTISAFNRCATANEKTTRALEAATIHVPDAETTTPSASVDTIQSDG